MIYRDGKFTIAKTIGPNVNVNGIVGELNAGRMVLQETGTLNIKQKEQETGDGTGEEQQA